MVSGSRRSVIVIGIADRNRDALLACLDDNKYDIRSFDDLRTAAFEITELPADAAIVLDVAQRPVDDNHLFALSNIGLRVPTLVVGREKSMGAALHFIREGIQDYLNLEDLTAQALENALSKAIVRQTASHRDNLTGLLNRSMINDRLFNAINQARRYDHDIAVMFIDVDRFHTINDGYDHSVGDKLLREVGERLKNVLRDSDSVGRLGGDIFIAVLPNMPQAHVLTIINEKVTQALSAPYQVDGMDFRMTVSIGASAFPTDGGTPDELLKCAEAAMKQVKSEGGEGFRFYRSDIHAEIMRRVQVSKALQRALKNNELELHYQPQVDLFEGHVVGVEALARWVDPDLGFVSPEEFIPLVEELGLMDEMGKWVLDTACKARKYWNDLDVPDFRVAVNVSAVQFQHGLLSDHVRNSLLRYGIEPSQLEVELTESSVMKNPEQTRDMMSELQNVGVRISIDDFGTGYSSLAYLKRFPLDVLKIDRSFVNDITVDSNGAAIVRTIIWLADNLGLHSIAEGVETREQLEFVRANGCAIAQGYYFSRPVRAQEIPEVVEKIASGRAEKQSALISNLT